MHFIVGVIGRVELTSLPIHARINIGGPGATPARGELTDTVKPRLSFNLAVCSSLRVSRDLQDVSHVPVRPIQSQLPTPPPNS